MEAPQGFDIATQTFDAAVRGDYAPLPTFDVLKANTAGVTVNSVSGTGIAGTRTSNTRFTRSSGVWISRVILPISGITPAGAYTNFVVGETVTETGSSSTGVVEDVSPSRVVLKTISAEFTGSAVLTGTTSGVTATGGTAVNVVENLKGYWAYSYVGTDTTAGTWSRVTSNVKNYVNVDINNLHASADKIILCKDKDTGREAMDIDYGSGA